MIAGLVAAVALASAPAPAVATAGPPAAPAIVVDPIGDIIQAAEGVMAQAVNAVDNQVRATLYYARIKGMRSTDSLGCKLAPMRTVAVDPSVFPRHSVLFIKETVGMKLPDGAVHDGFWYASDVGGAIKGLKVDLFTGVTAQSMRSFQRLNTATLTAVRVGVFQGCPSIRSPAAANQQIAAN
jgi:3D (Asp-Asp-Asp) domain-containing protein